MSGANGALPEISLEELARLIRILGMLGSSSDGEVVAAARFAAKWVREHGTDWQTLLTPEPEPGVSGVAVAADPDEAAQREDHAYRRGFDAGLARGAQEAAQAFKAQAAAQARMAGLAVAANFNPWTAGGLQTPPGAAQNPPHGVWPPAGPGGPTAAKRPVRASGAVPGGSPASSPVGGWPQGSWQWVCAELLTRHAVTPGVLRSREEAFVQDVLSRGVPTLTSAQETWLRDIAGRAGISW